MRESGLKSQWGIYITAHARVSLHAREWIEMLNTYVSMQEQTVSLHAREWIEIANALNNAENLMSLSNRESGLKC